MTRRRTILLLCTLLPLLLLGCQSYTAAKGKAAIEPIPSTFSLRSLMQEEEAALLKKQAQEEQQEREVRIISLTLREQELESSLEMLHISLAAANEENQRLADTLAELTLAQGTYPMLYKTENPTSLAKAGDTLQALMLPLSDVPWEDSTRVTELHASIHKLDVPILFVTGHKENVMALVEEMSSNAALFSTGAIITSFPILKMHNYGVEIQYQEEKTLRLIVANLPEYEVLRQFMDDKAWQATQKSVTPERLAHLQEMLEEGSPSEATLLGASLYEPSYRDWNTSSPVEYRQVGYLWPLSALLEDAGFYDTYSLTHFSGENTLATAEWGERVDFLYSRKILPLSSEMLSIGGEATLEKGGFSRFGILGTFVVP